MNEIVKAFTHLSREVLIYFLPGFLFVINILFLIYKIDNVTFTEFINYKYIGIISVIFAYILGHFSLAFRESFFNIFHIRKYDEFEKDKEYLFFIKEKKENLYEEFVERYNLLFSFRKNIAWVNIVLLLINLIFFILSSIYMKIFLDVLVIMIINLLLSIIFNCYYKTTFKSYKDRVILLAKEYVSSDPSAIKKDL